MKTDLTIGSEICSSNVVQYAAVTEIKGFDLSSSSTNLNFSASENVIQDSDMNTKCVCSVDVLNIVEHGSVIDDSDIAAVNIKPDTHDVGALSAINISSPAVVAPDYGGKSVGPCCRAACCRHTSDLGIVGAADVPYSVNNVDATTELSFNTGSVVISDAIIGPNAAVAVSFGHEDKAVKGNKFFDELFVGVLLASVLVCKALGGTLIDKGDIDDLGFGNDCMEESEVVTEIKSVDAGSVLGDNVEDVMAVSDSQVVEKDSARLDLIRNENVVDLSVFQDFAVAAICVSPVIDEEHGIVNNGAVNIIPEPMKLVGSFLFGTLDFDAMVGKIFVDSRAFVDFDEYVVVVGESGVVFYVFISAASKEECEVVTDIDDSYEW